MIARGETATFNLLLQAANPARRRGITSIFRHFGALGLFALAILDSSPLPTFAGPDILTAILAVRQRNPWYEYAAVATAGSVIGAYFTYRLAQKAGRVYLNRKFEKGKVSVALNLFAKWGAAILIPSTAIPFPFPTSLLFAAAGASGYRRSKYLTIIASCRAVRYATIAIVADHYGRHFVRALRNPAQYWVWLVLAIVLVIGLIVAAILMNRRFAAASAAWASANPQSAAQRNPLL